MALNELMSMILIFVMMKKSRASRCTFIRITVIRNTIRLPSGCPKLKWTGISSDAGKTQGRQRAARGSMAHKIMTLLRKALREFCSREGAFCNPKLSYRVCKELGKPAQFEGTVPKCYPNFRHQPQVQGTLRAKNLVVPPIILKVQYFTRIIHRTQENTILIIAVLL